MGVARFGVTKVTGRCERYRVWADAPARDEQGLVRG